MGAIEQLKKEHEAIKLMLKIFGKICDRFEAGKKVSSKHLEQILEFIRVFADKCHHSKEEYILFPEMVKAGIPKEGGPIAVMLMEHDTGRSYVKNIAEAVVKYKKGDSKSSDKIVENARNYIALLTEHIEKEDNILYMMADMHIPEKKQKELLEKFEEIENKRIGHGKHEEFHKMLKDLKKIYLK
ncbi:MAG: hemerythrin domain-containing protein [Nanoarchaeota archaeon]